MMTDHQFNKRPFLDGLLMFVHHFKRLEMAALHGAAIKKTTVLGKCALVCFSRKNFYS